MCAYSTAGMSRVINFAHDVKLSTDDFELNLAPRLKSDSIVLSCLTSGRHLSLIM